MANLDFVNIKHFQNPEHLLLTAPVIRCENKTSIRQVRAATSNRKTIKAGNFLWGMKTKQKVNTKIYDQIKKSLYNWIMLHPPVVKLQIFNGSLKVNIDCPTIPQMVT